MTEKVSFPDFPVGTMGLQRGSVLQAKEDVSYLGFKRGDEFPIGFDGQCVRCGMADWSIEMLEQEIRDGVWTITGKITDLNNPGIEQLFAEGIEQRGFPENKLGLRRGSVLQANKDNIHGLKGVEKGKKIFVGFDGECVRCGQLKWSTIEHLEEEIKQGLWRITGEVINLTDLRAMDFFAQVIERRTIPSSQ